MGLKFVLAAALAVGLASSANAAMTIAPASPHTPAVTYVAGGCGIGFHRGPYGGCRPNGGGGFMRACPPGMHLGPQGRRCWPN
jgi:hypothetical protein